MGGLNGRRWGLALDGHAPLITLTPLPVGRGSWVRATAEPPNTLSSGEGHYCSCLRVALALPKGILAWPLPRI